MPSIRDSGFYQGQHFIPHPLPPTNPDLIMTNQIIENYGKAMHMLGSVNELLRRLPNKERFLKAYLIKEAMLSSEIEGIYTTTTELFMDAPPASKETQLVQNYINALNAGIQMIRDDQYPIVSRVLNHTHACLLKEHPFAGVLRTQQVRVGHLLPAPCQDLPQLMRDLEIFINDDKTILPLIKAGLAHVQFETIHPYFDGNGRIGRLLILLILIKEGLLDEPLIYISYFFKKNHHQYYEKLDSVRQKGDFEGWIVFYLEAIYAAAKDACVRAKAIETLEESLKHVVDVSILTILFDIPTFTITQLSAKFGKSYSATKTIVDSLIAKKIVAQATQSQRNRYFVFTAYLEILEQDYID
ncbi:MAG: Fic/DOC family N-terminal domain-containing protein [Pseudomonadota bacterium]